ncbi:HpcH/HpaI aldolase/citrate lyase family protein [Chloroflexota bacterium]
MMRENHLRELLRAGKPSLGTRLQIAWPTVIELVGHSGAFDYVEILAEYAPYSHFSLENQGRAIDLFDIMSGMIKIEQESRQHLAVRAMSAGIQNLLFTDIRSASDAEECVRYVRAETPELGGMHGVGAGRDVGIVLDAGSRAFVQSTEDAVIAVMIEKKSAIESLEAILSVDGVDMAQFGPADYSVSIGQAGNRTHAAVREAEKHAIETALRMGVAPRAEIQNPRDAERYLEMGVRHFCMGTDVRTLFDYWKENGAEMKEILSS